MSGSLLLLFLALLALPALVEPQERITNCDDHGGTTVFQLRDRDRKKGFVAFVCEHIFVREKDHWLLFSRRLLRLKHTMMGGKIRCVESTESSFTVWCGYYNCAYGSMDMMQLCREAESIVPYEKTAEYTPARIEKYNEGYEEFLLHSGVYLLPAYLVLILLTLCISTTTFAK